MKKIKLYEEFIGEAYKFYDLFFNSHLDHNPECDILEGHLDKDSLITYGIYVKGPKQGLEFMEYYSGSNYKPTSDKRSSSRLFMVDKIPAKYKAMWEDLKKIYENEYAGSGRVSTRNESLVTEGQFSWMTQDTGNQIGSEKENTIAVTMFDDKGNKWLERKYDGYGEFGGKDYYELLAQMNGVENADRQDGIDIAFGKMKIKGDVLFPALIEEPNRFNYKRHDFTQEADNDPNQSWYQEPEYDDDDDDNYDDSNESKVTEATSYDPDDIFFLWDDCVDNGREGIERGHTGSGSSKHELFTFDTEVDGYDKFETELKKLLKKSGWKNEYDQDTLKVYEYESRVNEEETLIFDEIGSELTKLTDQVIDMLQWDITDQKWVAGLKAILKDLGKVEDTVARFDQKLGAIVYNESKVNEADSRSLDKIEQDLNMIMKSNINNDEKDKKIVSLEKIYRQKGGKKTLAQIATNESHFKVGDKVKMSHGGYGVIKSLDKESGADDEKYYNVELPSGEMHKHSPNELTKESAMSDIDLLAQEAKDFKSFVKEFKKEYKNMDAGSAKELEAWLQSVYDGAKTNMDEAIKPAGLSKAETKKVAETYAKAIGKNDGVKCTVNLKSLEEDSFDLDIDGEEYAGGSYIITLDGDVVNAALSEKPVYGQIDSTVDQIIKNLK